MFTREGADRKPVSPFFFPPSIFRSTAIAAACSLESSQVEKNSKVGESLYTPIKKW